MRADGRERQEKPPIGGMVRFRKAERIIPLAFEVPLRQKKHKKGASWVD